MRNPTALVILAIGIVVVLINNLQLLKNRDRDGAVRIQTFISLH